MNLRKAAEMALEFVDWLCGDDHSVRPKNKALDVREALRQALAQPVDAVNMTQEPVDETVKNRHEPVAWMMVNKAHGLSSSLHWKPQKDWHITWECKPLYTAPPKREWVGLTDEEIEECKIDGGLPHTVNWRLSAKVVQAKLKEKNG